MSKSVSVARRIGASLAVLALGTALSMPAVARKNHAIEVLSQNGAAIGFITSALAPAGDYEALRELPLDWVFIDMEHSPFDPMSVRAIIAKFQRPDGSFPVTPIFRIPANCSEAHFNQWMFKQMLDGGAFGIIVPHCDNRVDVENAAAAMRYPPFKDDAAPLPRGVRGAGGAPASWGLSFGDYAKVADLWPLDPAGELLFVPQIESREAIAKVMTAANLKTAGALFLGPADLHADNGYAGQSGKPDVEEQIQAALRLAQRSGIALGITTTAADAQLRLNQGFRFITIGASSPAALADILRGLQRP